MSESIIPESELEEVELYHPKSWWTEKVFSQDAKLIAIQYGLTAFAIGFVALVLSWFMRKLKLSRLVGCQVMTFCIE